MSIPSQFLEGIIYLLPKKQTRLEDITSWRPITLLNMIYKMYDKVLANRLQPCLSQLIQASQVRFVKDRSIFDNVFLFWEFVALAKQNNYNLAMVLLDFEKAYDNVDWGFMHDVFLAYSFPLPWVNAIESLYTSA